MRNGTDWQFRNVNARIGQAAFGLDSPGMAVMEVSVWVRKDKDRTGLAVKDSPDAVCSGKLV